MKKLYVAALILLAGISFTACNRPVAETTAAGISSGAPETKTIGAAGGTLSLLDGRLELTVPAGALASDVILSAQPITNTAFGGLGTGYRLEPNGTTFTKPITLMFKAGADDLSKVSIEGMGMAFQDAEGYWNRLPGATFDAAANTLSVMTDHFTDYAPVAVTLLQPLAKTVKPGESVQLELSSCYPVKVSTDPNGWRGYHCDNYLGVLESAKEWYVNGITGGDATVGTIKGISDTARYSAPNKPPSPSTVNASVKLTNGEGADAQNVELFSQITISEPGDFTGKITISWSFMELPFTITIDDVTLTLKDDGLDETNYTMSGTAKISPSSFTYGGNVYIISDAVEKPFTDDYGFKVRKLPQPAVRWGYAEGWTFASGGSTIAIVVNFATKKGYGCGQIVDVPIPDLDTLDGQYTMSCMAPAYSGTANWEFTKK
jgi:hypothetical protein